MMCGTVKASSSRGRGLSPVGARLVKMCAIVKVGSFCGGGLSRPVGPFKMCAPVKPGSSSGGSISLKMFALGPGQFMVNGSSSGMAPTPAPDCSISAGADVAAGSGAFEDVESGSVESTLASVRSISVGAVKP